MKDLASKVVDAGKAAVTHAASAVGAVGAALVNAQAVAEFKGQASGSLEAAATAYLNSPDSTTSKRLLPVVGCWYLNLRNSLPSVKSS